MTDHSATGSRAATEDWARDLLRKYELPTRKTTRSPMMTPTAPDRAVGQRLAALAAANEIRYRRAALKQNLRRHSPALAAVAASGIVEHPPHWAHTMKIRNLIVALPMVGDARADRALVQLRISPRKTLGGLSDRQRAEVVNWLNQRAAA